MNPLHLPQYYVSNNNSLKLATTTSSSSCFVPSPLSSSWTSEHSKTTYVGYTQLTAKCQLLPLSTSSSCGLRLCRKANCNLASHQAYLSLKQSRSKASSQDPRSGNNPCNPKPKVVDDYTIRNAFTKSYAFITPSDLSQQQPSSFRLDSFHDLPIPGGDRPETHRLIWNFLNHHLHFLLNKIVLSPARLDEFRATCFVMAMTNPTACLCMLVAERLVQNHLPLSKEQVASPTSLKRCQKYLKIMQQRPTDDKAAQKVLEIVIAMCVELVMKLQGEKSALVPLRSSSSQPTKPFSDKLKLPTLKKAMT